jgi:SulP family sulfate permease
MVWANVSDPVQKELQRCSFDDTADIFKFFASLDHALEWCEDKLIESAGIPLTTPLPTFDEQLKTVFPALQTPQRLIKYLQRLEISEGEYLIRQGDKSKEIFFLANGHLSVEKQVAEGKSLRLSTIQGGSILGEIGFYLDKPRTANVIALQPSVAYMLSEAQLDKMKSNEPELLELLHERNAILLAERLSAANDTLEILLE